MDREESLPAAPWLQEGPRVFRDQGGGDGFKTEGRVEDMVLPGEFQSKCSLRLW